MRTGTAASRLLGLLLPFLAMPLPGYAAGIEGNFRLVEQRYGGGQANLADLEEPLRLDFVRTGLTTAVTLRAGPQSTVRLDWPAFLTDRGPLSVDILEKSEDAASGSIRAQYRVRPSTDLTLEITEEYRLAEEGRALLGTYSVSFIGEGADPRGSYVLHRRFEREP